MGKDRVKKCEYCNAEIKKSTGCMNCDEELVMKHKIKKVMNEFKKGKLHSRSYQEPEVANL